MRLDEIAAEVVDAWRQALPTSSSDVSPCRPRSMAIASCSTRAVENVVRNAIDAVRERHPDGGGDRRRGRQQRSASEDRRSRQRHRPQLGRHGAIDPALRLGESERLRPRPPARAQDRAPSRRDALVDRAPGEGATATIEFFRCWQDLFHAETLRRRGAWRFVLQKVTSSDKYPILENAIRSRKLLHEALTAICNPPGTRLA